MGIPTQKTEVLPTKTAKRWMENNFSQNKITSNQTQLLGGR